MEDKKKFIEECLPYVWVVGLSIWGGAVSYFNKMKKYSQKFDIFKFLIEIFTSAFVGVLTFLICDWADLDWDITAAMVGIAGHMGTKAITVLENRYKTMIKGLTDES